MSLSYPSYNENYPKLTRKIKKQYISYRGSINTQKINAQYINYQYESTLERDYISILIYDLYCVEIVPQAVFDILDEKGKYHEYSVDFWTLYNIIYNIIYKHIREKCGCCFKNSSKISMIRNIRNDCNQKGLRPPAKQTIKNRMVMVN